MSNERNMCRQRPYDAAYKLLFSNPEMVASLWIVRDLLESRLGTLPPDVEAALGSLTDSEKLRRLMPAALHAASWNDMLKALAQL